jgi:hypothetical protein
MWECFNGGREGKEGSSRAGAAPGRGRLTLYIGLSMLNVQESTARKPDQNAHEHCHERGKTATGRIWRKEWWAHHSWHTFPRRGET